jgi:DNA adenine methylase
MQYMGSKNRHAKELLPIVLKDRKPDQWYVEPFVGGANMIDKVGGNRMGSDIHPHLICLLDSVAKGWIPPENVTEKEYQEAKITKAIEPKTAFLGFLCSFGSKWFGGFARNKVGTNYAKTGKNALLKQAPNLNGIIFQCVGYRELNIPPNSIIYCDPPYEGTTKYSTGGFDYPAFWQWCRDKSNEGHQVFVSEYNAPSDFECVWSKNVTANFDSNRSEAAERIEKLFIYRGE